MSRAYNARRKAKRQQARTESEGAAAGRFSQPRRLVSLVPIAVIVAILAIVGVLGFGGTSSAIDREKIQQRVSTLLAGIPQQGTTLGSPQAPVTVWVFADLQCPTVRRFVTAYLPSIIETWVWRGTVKLEYRSLRTDTYDEQTFYEQEAAALAAGRQNKMWNYALTFIQEQGQKHTDYATDEFFADIASQVPGLSLNRWRRDRKEPLLSKHVAAELYSARVKALQFTPSFLIDFSERGSGYAHSSRSDSLRKEVQGSLSATVDALAEEGSGDVPTLGFFGAR